MTKLWMRFPFAVLLWSALLATQAGCTDDSLPLESDTASDSDTTSDTTADTMGDTNGDADTAIVWPDLDLSAQLGSDEVRAGTVNEAGELIGGPKADGQLGDFKIYNSHVTFIVEAARRVDGYRYWGGGVADADVVRANGEPGNDLFGDWVPTYNLEILYPDRVELISDGSDGTAHIRVSGTTGPFYWAVNNKFITAFNLATMALDVVVDYELNSEDQALSIRHTVTNPHNENRTVSFFTKLSMHGDGVYPWIPGRGFSSASGPMPYVAAVGRDLSYAVLSDLDDFTTLIEYSSIAIINQGATVIPAGETRAFQYWLAVGENGSSSLDQAHRNLVTGSSSGQVTGEVELPASATADRSWVVAWQGEAPIATAPVTESAEQAGFQMDLEPGNYELQVFSEFHAASSRAPVSVATDRPADVSLSVPEPAYLDVTIDGPTRLTFFHSGEVDEIPDTIDALSRVDWANGVTDSRCLIEDGELALPAGPYHVVATRGFACEQAEFDLDLTSGARTDLDVRLRRSVDTSGFLSSDFHVHAHRSWDSHADYESRARESLCEGIELPIITEHGSVGGLDEVLEQVDESDPLNQMAGPVGQEVTSFLYGHFNLFPMVPNDDDINRGAVFPLDKTPLELFAAMRAQGGDGVIIQVNHPRNATLTGYFEHVSLNPETIEVTRPDDWSTDFDAVEVFNGRCSGRENLESLDDWIGLTNHGLQTALSSGSDSHDPATSIGIPRNYIALDLDAVRSSNQALVDAVRSRRMSVSCGPFIRFESTTGQGMGELAPVDADGNVRFEIQIQAPSWIAVDAVVLLEDGVEIQRLPIVGDNPDGGIVFDDVLSASPQADAWYTVQAFGSGDLAPLGFGVTPFAMTNPIDVDANGDGVFTAPQ